MAGPLRIFAKHLLEAGQCVPSLWEAARPSCAPASSWHLPGSLAGIFHSTRQPGSARTQALRALWAPPHPIIWSGHMSSPGCNRNLGLCSGHNQLFHGSLPLFPQAAAPGPAAARPGVGALPEPAVDLRPPAGAGAVFCGRGDCWVREPSGHGSVSSGGPCSFKTTL